MKYPVLILSIELRYAIINLLTEILSVKQVQTVFGTVKEEFPQVTN